VIPVPVDRITEINLFEMKEAQSVLQQFVRAPFEALRPSRDPRIGQFAGPGTPNKLRRTETAGRHFGGE
jgi:hypothetical protein